MPIANNEVIKRRYRRYLKEARRLSEPSIDKADRAIDLFERWSRFRDFNKFHVEQAIAFKTFLFAQTAKRSGGPLSRSTLLSTTRHLREFFEWLSEQSGYRSRISRSDAAFFHLSRKDAAIASAKKCSRTLPELEDVLRVLSCMPVNGSVSLRNQAIVALTLLTGVRVAALVSLKLKHLDLQGKVLNQDAREVDTKFAKSFQTYFFPVGDLPTGILERWVDHLVNALGFEPEDPLFPASRVVQDGLRRFTADSLSRNHWRGTGSVRKIFRNAFESAGFNYVQPHGFRHILARLGETLCRSPEEFKAWSQNLGHESVGTTFTSYGQVASHRQRQLIESVGLRPLAPPAGVTREDLFALRVQIDKVLAQDLVK